MDQKAVWINRKNIVVWLLRWPENKHTGLVPWFVIAWRLPWWLVLMIGMVISWIAVAMMYGLSRAEEFWHRAG
jgi:hypothetical protein